MIDDRCKVQNNVSVYDCVTLERGVFCDPSMVFTKMHRPRALIERKSEYRDTLVREVATLGANCTIVCGGEVGRYALVGAGAVINRNAPDFAPMVGVAARQIGWISRDDERIPLPVEGEGEYLCPHTRDRYVPAGRRLRCDQARD